MNTQVRFYRVVVAAALGAVLWAACSSPPQDTRPAWAQPVQSYTHTGSYYRTGPGPVDLLKTTADTNPEYRVGLSSFATKPFQNLYPAGGNLPIINVVQADRSVGGVLISEPAGAAKQDSAHLQSYQKELGDRALQGDP